MNTQRIWQRLVWKDGLMIKPLLLAIGIAILAAPLLVAFVSATSDDGGRAAMVIAVMMWVLLPNLVAIGAPAMLIGTEEETGTFRWLRTLPLRWQLIADSKLLVSALAVAGAWLLASCSLWICIWALPHSDQHVARAFPGMLTMTGVLQAMFFSATLLLIGFASSYALRSPVAALVALLPIVSITWYVIVVIATILMDDRYANSLADMTAPAWQWWRLIAVGMAFLAGLFVLQRWLARRRLLDTEKTLSNPMGAVVTAEAYRPPPMAVVGLYRPSPIFALLWQQWRQVQLAVLPMVVIVFVLCVMSTSRNYFRPMHAMAELAIPVTTLALMWLGALTFYGDSVRRQCAFFADRGISKSQIWLTRIIPTLVPALFLIAMVFVTQQSQDGPQRMGDMEPISVAWWFAFYGCGQLVSLWVKRPVLSFFATPAFAMISLMMTVIFLTGYVGYQWAMLAVPPVLLFASWRLIGRWLDGRMDRGFHVRVVAWTVAAAALPILIVMASRWVTTPMQMDGWRRSMLAESIPAAKNPRQGLSYDLPISRAISFEAMSPITAGTHIRPQITDRLRLELDDAETIGFHVGFSELRGLVSLASLNLGLSVALGEEDQNSDAMGMELDSAIADLDSAITELADSVGARPAGATTEDSGDGQTTQDAVMRAVVNRQLATEVLLKWSREVRQLVLDGQEGLIGLVRIAEPAERLALHALNADPTMKSLVSDKPLVDMIPSDDLRRRSRRIAVIHEWRRYQHGWNTVGFGHLWNSFGGVKMLDGRAHRYWIERNRADRYVDLFTRQMIEQIRDGGLFVTVASREQWRDDFLQAKLGSLYQPGSRQLEYTLTQWVEGMSYLPATAQQVRREAARLEKLKDPA
ncbi:hypothetical protein K227x_39560 [Rubripirellula lacrimiformis]|uniref:ABC-2 family transporter protein n=1 Tax=Rubripirellula lacrimiformis TaxID=1930273 RepID=A0A517NEK1_9BACT|nr:ABC transporter permease [Rubripirellula lacrimiformis]QDT05555.1 hypothetical protein K227x_39560 [Rubripirellula lacrimiformis]